jgi:glycosyltransferase involved in cell wall biosynthesis
MKHEGQAGQSTNFFTPADLTVIIPTADRPALLREAIASLTGQSQPPSQIIVVDNGNTAVALSTQQQSSIKIVRMAPRQGPGRSRNAGAWASRSRLIGFLDDDDCWDKDYIYHSLACLNATGADVVVGQLLRQHIGGEVRPYKLFPADPAEQRGVFYKNPGFGGQNLVISKDMFVRHGGFDERMPASVDRDLAARFLLGGVKIVPEPMAKAILRDHGGFRVRDNQVMGNRMFIAKHWKQMRWQERIIAQKTLWMRELRRHFNQASRVL